MVLTNSSRWMCDDFYTGRGREEGAATVFYALTVDSVLRSSNVRRLHSCLQSVGPAYGPCPLQYYTVVCFGAVVRMNGPANDEINGRAGGMAPFQRAACDGASIANGASQARQGNSRRHARCKDSLPALGHSQYVRNI